MKLSMHTLADNLTRYQPEINITEGRRVLQNARICTNENKISLSSVFLTEMSSGRILCANGKDTLILHSEDIFEVLNDILEIFDKYNDFEMKTEAMIESGCSAEELLQEFAALTGLSFILADATFWAYATAFASEEFDRENYVQIVKNGSLLPLDALTEVNKLPFIRTKGIGPYHIDIPGSELVYTTTRNMFRGDSHVGWLVALKMHANTGQGELDLIDELGNITEKMLLRDSDSNISLEKTSMFLDILEDRPVDLETVIARLSSFGWYEDDRKVVYAMQYRSQKGEASHAIDSRIGSFTDNTFQMYFQDTMILIVNKSLSDIKAVERSLLILCSNSGFVIGKSPEFNNIFHLKNNFSLARIAMQLAGNDSKVYEFSDVVVPYCCKLINDFTTTDIMHPAIEQLEKYDRLHKTDFLPTLEIFLKNERNYTEVSKLLNIHRSSLLYRLDKIRKIVPLDLDNEQERFHLLLSFKMMRK